MSVARHLTDLTPEQARAIAAREPTMTLPEITQQAICIVRRIAAEHNRDHQRVLFGAITDEIRLLFGECPGCPLQQMADEHPRTAGRLAIWHEGGDRCDRCQASICRDVIEPITGEGDTVGAAIEDLGRKMRRENEAY